jgi:hypothetical protein
MAFVVAVKKRKEFQVSVLEIISWVTVFLFIGSLMILHSPHNTNKEKKEEE